MICKQCNREIPEGSRVCPFCGTAQETATYQTAVQGKRFCPNCGTEISAESRFCPNCGTDAGAPVTSTQNYYAAPTQPAVAVPKATTVAGVLQEMCNSPLAIIMLGLYSLGIVLSIASTGSIFSKVADVISNLYGSSYFGYGSEISQFIGILESMGVGIGIVSAIPTIIMAVGLWLFWWTSRNGRPQTTGLTIVQVLIMISCVSAYISAGGIAIIGVIFAANTYKYLKGTAIGIMLLLWLIAGVYSFFGTYYLKAYTTVKTIKTSILTAVPSDVISGFVGGFTMVLGGISLLSALVSLFTGSFSAFLNGLCGGGSSLLMALMLFTYRTRMQELMGKVAQYR